MDPNASILEIIGKCFTILGRVTRYVNTAGTTYRSIRFGPWGWWLYALRLVDTDLVQETHWHINAWKDEDVLNWKNSYMANCNAITVAGSIFASIGLAALQLPDMNSTHWTARALLCASMALGILSIAFATSQQQRIAMLNTPLAVRLWLSRGKTQHDEKHSDKYEGTPFADLPLESSISASKVVAIPRVLLNLAVFLFIVGFGIYILFAWLNGVEDQATNYRNIFIVFVLTVGMFFLYYSVWDVGRLNDHLIVSDQFDLGRLGGFPEGSPLHDLQRELTQLQSRLNEIKVMVYSAEAVEISVLPETSPARTVEQAETSSLRDDNSSSRSGRVRPPLSDAENPTVYYQQTY